jgi:8-oxo-dGTP pyrophosphatase MutT (NUDIX family)
MNDRASAPALPAPSATIMLIRDKRDADGIEVFMLKRHSKADFGGAFVFPGGLAAESDHLDELEPYCIGYDDPRASAELNLPAGGLAYRVAAIRECFEESGYLLASDEAGEPFRSPGDSEATRFARMRGALDRGDMTMLDFCRETGLRLACNALHYVSFWTTPEPLPRRYSTRFFVARVPAGQTGVHDGRETVESRWVCPVEAVETDLGMRLGLHPPTTANLALLAPHRSAEEAIAAARSIDPATVSEIMPRLRKSGDGIRIVLPGQPGYEDDDA